MRTYRSRSARLAFEPLEGREVPAGSITASLSDGKLTISGDDRANGLTVLVGANSVTLTPDGSTAVNGKSAGTAVTLLGTATSLSADLAGGDDTLSIDSGNDFVLPGAAAFNLGDGNNELNLTTSGHITLGSLSVTSGDGDNFVTVSPGIGLGTVNGAANFNYGNGASATILSETKFSGPTGVTIRVAPTGSGFFQLNDVTVSKALSAELGNSFQVTNTISGSTLGSLSVKGFEAEVGVADTAVTGDVSVKGTFYAYLIASSGAFSARDVTVAAGGLGAIELDGTTATINGNLAVSGGLVVRSSVNSSGTTEVKGNVTDKGGSLENALGANSHFKPDGNVTVAAAAGGLSDIRLGDGAAPLDIGGNLSIKTGAGSDDVSLLGVAVAGNTAISTGSGADLLTIDDGSTFAGTFAAHLGNGDDTIAIAQNTGQAAPVTFAGKTTILAGNGDGTLLLGLAPGSGGDANSKAVFMTGGDRIDGGAGYNTFDGFSPGEAPSQYTGLSLADFFNWVDPNP